jgi:glycosyltransferase involved in cell wall biosynthesis
VKPRVCFVSQHGYPNDPRMTVQAQAYHEAGFDVDIACIRSKGQRFHEKVEGFNVYRLPSMTRKRASKIRYVAEYLSFWIPAFIFLTIMQVVRRYRIVFVVNLPDALVFSAVFPRLLGAKIMFDFRELTPEMFIDRFGAKPGSRVVRLMEWLERLAIDFSHAVVTCTYQQKQALIKRGADPNKIWITLNVSNPYVFKNAVLPDPDEDTSKEFRIITHGTIIKRYGHATLVRAMQDVIKRIPQAHLTVCGKGQMKPELERLTKELNLTDHITFAGFVPDEQLIPMLRNAHVGAVTVERNPEADTVHTHKMFEYMALGVPIVISRTTAVEHYFTESELCFFEADNPQDLANAIIELAENPRIRYTLAKNALDKFNQNSPAVQKATYMDMVAHVLNRTPGGVPLEVR